MRMSKILIVIFLTLGIKVTFSQITIESTDMPSASDTVRTSIAIQPFNFDFSATGENFTWDFSELLPASQRLDTFKTIQETPVFFWPSFFTVANIAISFNPGELLPGLAFDHAYQFIQKNVSGYRDYGYGLTIQGLPSPLRFTSPDVLYSFPMNYGNNFSSDASLSFALPDLGYLAIERNRNNTVDGWGELVTPYGIFDVLRLKSEVFEVDSVYVDSLGQGFSIERNYTEFKWLAKNEKIPVLTVVDDVFLGTSIIYKDSIRDLTVDLEAVSQRLDWSIFPNPFKNELWLKWCGKSLPFSLKLITVEGIIVFEDHEPMTSFCEPEKIRIPTNLNSGLYLLQIKTDQGIFVRKLLKD